MVDEIILRRGVVAPPAEPDDADAPIALNPPLTLDLHAHEIASVVWCTGFTGDFSWLDSALLDADGQPRHEGAAAAVPGVWYVGLRWLTRRGSGLLYGFPGDAATVADAVEAFLGQPSSVASDHDERGAATITNAPTHDVDPEAIDPIGADATQALVEGSRPRRSAASTWPRSTSAAGSVSTGRRARGAVTTSCAARTATTR